MITRRSVTFAAMALVIGGAAWCQNLVSNGTLDTNVDGWQSSHPAIVLTWTDQDADGSPSSGSALGTNGASGAFDAAIYQCVATAITAGASYDYGAALRVPSFGVFGLSFLQLTWFSGAGCTGGALGSDFMAVNVLDQWVDLDKTGVVAPVGAVSAMVVCRIFKQGSGASYSSYLDNVYLRKQGGSATTQELFLPAAAAKHGLNQTYWSTDGWFVNRSNALVTLAGAFLRPGVDNSGLIVSPTVLGSIQPGGFLRVSDVVTKLGGSEETGGVYLRAFASGAGLPAELVVGTSYTYTPNDLGPGNYGQGIPAVSAGADAEVVVAGVFQGSTQRTNIGAVNTSGVTVTIQVTVANASGSTVGSTTWTLPAYSQIQVSVSSLGISSLDGGFVTFVRTSGGGTFRAYSSTVDQQTGDAVYNAAR